MFPLSTTALRGLAARFRPPEPRDATETVIAEQRMAHQLALLDRTAVSAGANAVALAIVAYLFRNEVSHEWLFLWVGAMFAVVLVRGLRIKGWLRHARRGLAGPTVRQRLREHVFFAVLLGLSWSLPSAVVMPAVTPFHMLAYWLSLAGCMSGAIPALGSYRPAFFGFALACVVPNLFASLWHSTPWAGEISLLLLIYIGAVANALRSYNRTLRETLELGARNMILSNDLLAAEATTAEAIKSKWDSFAHLSHELRTPMNAVLGFSEMMRLQIRGPLSEHYLKYAEDIHDSGSHALALIDSILDVSRSEQGGVALSESEFDPAELVQECIRMVEPQADAKEQRLAGETADGMPLLRADRVKLRQAVLNLLGNAINYTPEGGDILLEARLSGSGLMFTVTDTGVGIDGADLARCQEPFIRLGNALTASVAGMGLGLSIVKHAVEAHGGQLTIQSVPGEGTAASILLPEARLGAVASAGAPHVEPAARLAALG